MAACRVRVRHGRVKKNCVLEIQRSQSKFEGLELTAEPSASQHQEAEDCHRSQEMTAKTKVKTGAPLKTHK